MSNGGQCEYGNFAGVSWGARVAALTDNELHLWLLRLEAPALSSQVLTALLSPPERERARCFKFERDRDRFVAARGQLRLVLSHYVGVEPESVALATQEGGKPYVSDAPSAPFFNLSHSGGLALVAIASQTPVGVDLEEIRDFERRDDVARTTFAPSEWRALAALPADRRLEAFYACWTRKEAFVKADGRGLSRPLDSFEVNVDPDAPAVVRETAVEPTVPRIRGLWDVDVAPGYRAAVAAVHEKVTLRQFMLRPEASPRAVVRGGA